MRKDDGMNANAFPKLQLKISRVLSQFHKKRLMYLALHTSSAVTYAG